MKTNILISVLVALVVALSLATLLNSYLKPLDGGVRELQVMSEKTQCYMFQGIRKGGEVQVTEVIIDIPCIKEQWPFVEVTIRE